MLKRNAILAVLAVLSLQSVPALADGLGPGDFFHDAGLYFTSPLRWDAEDWMYFGGTLAAIGAAHTLDTRVRDHFAGPNPVLNGQDPNSTKDALPAAALFGGTWLVSTLMGDKFGQGESYSMIEASVLTVVTEEGMKYVAGRQRPNATLSPNDWRAGGTSFPSIHAGAAFTIGTVFAESGDDDYRWLRRIVGYGIASATVYLRLHDNVHWFSDVVAGSALGMATAHFSINRRLDRLAKEEGLQGMQLSVVPEVGGLKLAIAVPLN